MLIERLLAVEEFGVGKIVAFQFWWISYSDGNSVESYAVAGHHPA